MSEQHATTGPRPAELPEHLRPGVVRFAAAFRAQAGAQLTGLYLVGSAALADMSQHSNIDLVALTQQPLAPAVLKRLRRMHKLLRRNGRDPVVCYTTWDGVAGDPAEAMATTYVGRRVVAAERMANPMTWAILRDHPLAVIGPPRPSVASSHDGVCSWFAGQLPGLRRRVGNLMWRRSTSRLVVEAVRCAVGARTGEVVSLSKAAELWSSNASSQDRRILVDAAGYRRGHWTGMYWGPFERRQHARHLLSNAQQQLAGADALTA